MISEPQTSNDIVVLPLHFQVLRTTDYAKSISLTPLSVRNSQIRCSRPLSSIQRRQNLPCSVYPAISNLLAPHRPVYLGKGRLNTSRSALASPASDQATHLPQPSCLLPPHRRRRLRHQVPRCINRHIAYYDGSTTATDRIPR